MQTEPEIKTETETEPAKPEAVMEFEPANELESPMETEPESDPAMKIQVDPQIQLEAPIESEPEIKPESDEKKSRPPQSILEQTKPSYQIPPSLRFNKQPKKKIQN